jgi:hypothetical protein
MKKLLALLSFIALFNMAAKAQLTEKSPEQRAAHITKALSKRLNLTAAQATQVNTAFLSQATRMDSLKTNLSQDKKLNSLTRRSIVLATEKQVLSVLNDDQKKQFMAWEQMKKDKHKQMKAQAVQPQS